MPKGKGTYGSQVGRPPKANARERSVREYAGGGRVGFNSIGQVRGYEDGGEVEDGWESLPGGARIRRFNKKTSGKGGITPETKEAVKKISKFVKKTAKKIAKASKKAKYKRQGKRIERMKKRTERMKKERSAYEQMKEDKKKEEKK